MSHRIGTNLCCCTLLAVCGLTIARAAAGDDPPAAAQQPAPEQDAAAEPAPGVQAQPPAVKPPQAAPAPAANQQARRRPNKLVELLQNLFGQRQAREAPAADEPEPATAGLQLRRGAPHDSESERQLRKAATHSEAGNWRLAIELLQFQLDNAGDASVMLPGGTWTQVRSEANRMLGELPAEALESYRLQYGATAAQMLADALAANDVGRVAEVANRYFYTTAGHEAANYLGTFHFDRGEFGMAARWFASLVRARADVAADPKWRIKAAFAFRHAGEAVETVDLMRDLLAQPGGETFELGGRRIDPAHWLNETGLSNVSPEPVLDDWPLFLGTPSRTGTAVGGEPVLVPRWFVPLTHSHAVSEQTEMLIQDLIDQDLSAVLTFSPVMVDGKAVFRTLRGVQVIDAASGSALWETVEDVSPETLLNGEDPSVLGQRRRARARFGGVISQYNGTSADRHPLTSLLFRNGAYGIIGSDGEQLFVIEDQAALSGQQPGQRGAMNADASDPYRRNWSSNQVASYDLQTGRPRWSVGGPQRNEGFDLALAGTHFSGVPVRAGNELFVVGEQDHEIRLFALDPATGRPRWSTLIGEAEVPIGEDFGRRWWASQVAVSDGVVVCPTTVGWLVAVDRLNRSVLWTRRYETPQADNREPGGAGPVSFESLNERWAPSAPIAVDGKVIYAPAETPSLFCIDLLDGNVRWRRPKGDFLYVAGVFDQKVLLVGKSSIAALAVENGSEAWPPLALAEAAGKPSGMGVAADGRYYLPLQSGELWTLELASGRLLTKSYLPRDDRPLGNLAMYRGLLLSLNPFGMTAYEQREFLEGKIAELLKDDPRDAWALLRQADVHLLERKYADALAALRQIDPADLGAHADRYRLAMREGLEAAIRSDWTAHDRELEELSKLLAGDEQGEILVTRLEAQQHRARGQSEAAFDLLWQLAARTNSSEMLDDGPLRVRLDAWLAGQFADLWRDMSEAARAAVDARLSDAARALPAGDLQAQERFVALFGFHTAALQVERQLADAHAAADRFAEAENLLLRQYRSVDRRVAAAALERLAQLMREAELPSDSDYYYGLLEAQFPDVELTPGVTASALVHDLRKQGSIGGAQAAEAPPWNLAELTLSRIGTNYGARYVQQLIDDRSAVPFFREHRVEVDLQQQRLAVVNVADNSLHWLLPLRSGNTGGRDLVVAGRSNGHVLFVLHRDVLHCVSPVRRRILWSHPLDPQAQATGYAQFSASLRPMQPGTRILSRHSLLRQARSGGLLAVANDQYVCVYGRRRFTVLDTLTGAERWSFDGASRETLLVGNEDVLYLVSADRSEVTALRSLDGKVLDLPGTKTLLSESVAILPAGLLHVGTQSSFLGLSGPQTVVRLYDPLTRQEHWRHSWTSDTYLSLLDGGRLLALGASGRLDCVDIASGRVTRFDDVPPEQMAKSPSEIFAVAEADALYVVVNGQWQPGFRRQYSSQELPSVRVNGFVSAFDLTSGRRLWVRETTQQNLLRQGSASSPLLIFASKEYVQEPDKGLGYWRMNLLVLDKQTGTTLIETTGSGNYSFQSIDVNAAEQYVELRTNNQILRLQAADGTRASVDPVP